MKVNELIDKLMIQDRCLLQLVLGSVFENDGKNDVGYLKTKIIIILTYSVIQ